jgi:hypothetical protein
VIDSNIQLAVIFLAMIGGMTAIWVGPKLLARWRHFSVIDQLVGLIEICRSILGQPKKLFILILVMLVFNALSIIAVYALAIGLGDTPNLGELAAILPAIFLITALPVSINGWGVREAAMIGLLPFVGIPAEHAVLISVGFGLGLLVTRLPFGLLWFGQWRDQ